MLQYVALLRGVNVGGKNKLPMAELVTLMEKSGLHNVTSYIQSGNLLFSAEEQYQAQTLETLIEQAFAFRPLVLLFERGDFEQIVSANLFANEVGNKVHIYFYQQHQVDLPRLESYLAAGEEYQISDNAFYLFAPAGVGRSKLVANIEKCLACKATGRNLNTVNKLLQLLNRVSH